MKNLIAIAIIAAGLTACNTAQIQASAAYIGAEVATTQLITKNPALIPVAQAIVNDWAKFQGGKLTAADEAGLLQQVVAATKGQVTPTEAALLEPLFPERAPLRMMPASARAPPTRARCARPSSAVGSATFSCARRGGVGGVCGT